MNNTEDPDVLLFVDTMTALGLKQHVLKPTHRFGNTLDLIFTDELENAMNCQTHPLISDHNPVTLEIKIQSTETKAISKKMRKTKQVNNEDLIAEFEAENIIRNGSFDALVTSFEKELARTFDAVAPLQDVRIREDHKMPWFDEETLAQKRKVRKLEDKYHKYKLDSIWDTYLSERRRYVNLVRRKKKMHFSSKVLEHKGDSKALHQLISSLTAANKDNPMPINKTNKELANEFLEFFIEKIQKIPNNLENHPLLQRKQILHLFNSEQ